MQRNMDTIQFESRRELEEIGIALQEYMDKHPDKAEDSSVKELFNLLDCMHMEW